MKLRITILKYHLWCLCQISLQLMLLPILINTAEIYLHWLQRLILEDRNCAKNLTKINKFYDDLLNRLNGFFLVLLKLLLVHFCFVIFTGTVPWFFNFLYYIILVITPICNTATSLLFRLKYGLNYRVKIEPELAEEQHLHHYWNPMRGKNQTLWHSFGDQNSKSQTHQTPGGYGHIYYYSGTH